MGSIMLLAACCMTSLQMVVPTTTREALAHNLLDRYISYVSPGNTTISIGTSFICGQYNDVTKLLISRVWDRYEWSDNRLVWDPSKFGGITEMQIPVEKIWTPDIMMYNVLYEKVQRDKVNALVESDGTVTWIPPTVYTTPCTKSGQAVNCEFIQGSWTYDAYDINLVKLGEGFTTDDTTTSSQICPLTLRNIESKINTKYYDCCPNPYSSYEVKFSFVPTY